MVRSILKKQQARKLVSSAGTPQLSMTDYEARHRVLSAITGRALPEEGEEETDENVCPLASPEEEMLLTSSPHPPPPQVEITGLELLMFSDDMNSSDYSFDSYAQDSFEVAHVHMLLRTNHSCSSSSTGSAARVGGGRRAPRRTSNSSSTGELAEEDDEISYGYGGQDVPRRRVDHHHESSQSSSLGDDDDDDDDDDDGDNRLNPVPDYSRYKCTRRSSIDSYAEDSVDFEYAKYNNKNKSSSSAAAASCTRRSSIGSSYANDSVNLQNLSKMKRRLSNSDSLYAFSKDIYDTQSINTGGAGRAA